MGTSTFSTTSPPFAGPRTATASITQAAGDTETCTFTDTKRGQIVVDKVTSPSGDPTSFSFSTTGSGYASFTLTDAAAPNGQTLSPGAYSVSEAIPAGWVLTGLSCASSLGTSTFTTTAPPVAGPGTATASITLAADDTVTCTFTNTGVSQPPPEPGPQDPIITTVSCNPPTVQVNQPTTCTATVSQVVVGTPITTPTGIARFFADSSTTAFATCTLRATATTGVANCSVAYRASTVGAHNITARYPGDSTHEASTTLTPFPVTVVPAVPGLGL